VLPDARELTSAQGATGGRCGAARVFSSLTAQFFAVRLDLRYIENWSLALDSRII
jgi:lipopolysaccharide/colanic/teichoic acid biosynthesis glycosyltransferase